jgi:predicted AAA+ superfamily ATPase
MDYAPRIIDGELDQLLSGIGAIAIDGPKAVGKTATATRRAATIFRLDDPAQREVIAADATRLVAGEPPILIDEWQRLPESWDLVRRAVDADPTAGRFLLTGSATPLSAPTHSGAGRIVSVRMRPMALSERGVGVPSVALSALLTGERPPISGSTQVGLEQYVDEIVASGFPGLRNLKDRQLRAQLDGYIDRIVEHDFLEMGGYVVRNPQVLRRWLMAYAAATSTTASYETIRDASASDQAKSPARTTTQPYRDVLQRLWIVEPVPAWLPSRNRFSRLAAPPKHQLADPALAARLLGVGAEALLEGRGTDVPIPREGSLIGDLFEALVTLSVRAYAQGSEASVRHLRTKGGEHEVDLILERGDGRVVAVEVKLGRNINDSDVRHLRWLRDQLGDGLLDAMVVTTGPEAYRRHDGIAVVPAALLGP